MEDKRLMERGEKMVEIREEGLLKRAMTFILS